MTSRVEKLQQQLVAFPDFTCDTDAHGTPERERFTLGKWYELGIEDAEEEPRLLFTVWKRPDRLAYELVRWLHRQIGEEYCTNTPNVARMEVMAQAVLDIENSSK